MCTKVSVLASSTTAKVFHPSNPMGKTGKGHYLRWSNSGANFCKAAGDAPPDEALLTLNEADSVSPRFQGEEAGNVCLRLQSSLRGGQLRDHEDSWGTLWRGPDVREQVSAPASSEVQWHRHKGGKRCGCGRGPVL